MRTKVKALEWREHTEDRGDGHSDATGDWSAYTAFGTYVVELYFHSDGVQWSFDVMFNGVTIADHDDPDAAKAAAQSYFDAAIASVLEDDWQTMGDAQIKHMVDRFLAWPLPDNFAPDGGISFERIGNKGNSTYQYTRRPSGTNLLAATQAEEMVRHMVERLPPGFHSYVDEYGSTVIHDGKPIDEGDEPSPPKAGE